MEGASGETVTGVGRDHIGPYRLLRLIQAGKATKVWEAMNSTDQRRVAVKVLHGDRVKDKVELQALRHEFVVGSSLDHPHVNRMLEMDANRATPYLVMEYFPAPNLKVCLRQGLPQVQRFLPEIIRSSAEAIGHMHERGWVHRDIKPENLLVNEEGFLKLIDFAIAQRAKSPGMMGKWFAPRQTVQGTRSYMSPEQIRGSVVDARADIYSYGCTLFELMTGKLPYTGTNADDLLNRHLRAPIPSAAAFRSEITPEFSRLIGSMMAKEPNDRPVSMAKFLESLQNMKILKQTV